MWIRLLVVFFGLSLWDSAGGSAAGSAGDEASSSSLNLNELAREHQDPKIESEGRLGKERDGSDEIRRGRGMPQRGKDKMSLLSHLEMRNTESRLLRPEPSRETRLDNVSLALKGHSGSLISYFMEASIQQTGSDTDLLLGQVFIELFQEEGTVEGRVGQLMMPVGWLNERQDLFFSKPSYYKHLYPGSKPLDLGVSFEWRPFGDPYPYLTAGCYSGQGAGLGDDERDMEAKRRPCEISVREKSDGVELFLTHFGHDLALHDALEADGFGFEFQSSEYFQAYKLRFGILSEAWRMSQRQASGPENEINAWMVFPYLQFDRIKIGYRWARTDQEVRISNAHRLRSARNEKLIQVEAAFTKSLKLVYESEQAFSSIPEADRWALRLLFDLVWPSQSGS
ncbi:MAG: hypothetical protein IPJ71_09045 [Bdellovibrionales bacterium]|nr:hypothetical protein [Bdellovibrionales bacterium]